MASLDPQWAGRRTRRIMTDDDAFDQVETDRDPPKEAVRSSRSRGWSGHRKLATYLSRQARQLVVRGGSSSGSRDPHRALSMHVPAHQDLEGVVTRKGTRSWTASRHVTDKQLRLVSRSTTFGSPGPWPDRRGVLGAAVASPEAASRASTPAS